MELVSQPSWLANVLPHDNGVTAIETLKASMELISQPSWLANVLPHDNGVTAIETLKASC
jgi:hypothetical protein